MDLEQIGKVKEILTKWNPLGERAKEISDLNSYEIEATDIIWHLNKNPTTEQIQMMTSSVLEQAFGLHVNTSELKTAAEKIYKVLNKK